MAGNRSESTPTTAERKPPTPEAGKKADRKADKSDCADRPQPTDGEIVSSGGSIPANRDR